MDCILWGIITGLIALMLYVVVSFGRSGWEVIRISLDAPHRIPRDVSNLQRPFPDQAQASPTILHALGFVRLGEIETILPGLATPFTDWLFTDAPGTTVAEVTTQPLGMTDFLTLYGDGAVVETIYPMGERINRTDFRCHTITTDLQLAYQHHLQQVNDFQTVHGSPCQIGSMEDYFRLGRIYSARHVRHKFQRLTRLSVIQVMALVYTISVMGVLILVPAQDWLTAFFERIPWAFGLLLPAVFVSCASLVIGSRGSRQSYS